MSSRQARPKILRVGTQNAVVSLDPQRAHDFTSHAILAQVFDAPYVRRGDRFDPVLVRGAPVRRDARAFEVTIDTSLRFSDGSPLTAADVATSVAPALAALDVTVISQGPTLVLESANWRHRVEVLLSASGARVAKRTAAGMVGTGAFALAETTPELVRLVRNPHARRPAALDGVEFRWFSHGASGRPDALLAAIGRGEIDFSFALSRDDVQSLDGVRKLYQPGMSTAFVALNTAQPALADVVIRRAIARALDRQRLAEACYSNPAAFVARSLLPPALGRGNDGLRHDLAAARELLGARAVPQRLRLLQVWGPRPYLPRPDAVAAGIADQLGKLGIAVIVTVARDGEDFAARLAAGDFELVLGGWVAESEDPVDYLEALVSSSAIPGRGHLPVAASNYARWVDPVVDALLGEARLGQPTAIDDLLARVASQVPFVPLMHGPRVVVHSWRVKGYDPEASVIPELSTLDVPPDSPSGSAGGDG